MPQYIADLHIHSRFSMATSKSLNIPHLAGWAMCKGINVLGTGDFTHPKWQQELKDNLVFDEDSGFYKALPAPENVLPDVVQPEATPPLFCLQTEISSIYKRGGRVHKVHNVVLMPTLDDVARFSKKLATIGNINSDGRPILGLDSHDLLEIILEISEKAVLIPAHIWTPWFSLFGSRSGFDRIEDCYDDLTSHIFALETGLSSDPAMNRLLSALDGYALISNSDAHSGPNLGREANLFTGKPSYSGMIDALRCSARRTPDASTYGSRYEGTLEFYPEEGKYHLDGHRACNIIMTPEEAEKHNNICPVCGKKLTIGVLHRVWELADRKTAPVLDNEPSVHPIIPLPTILAELMGAGSTSRKVQKEFAGVLSKLGNEFEILASRELADISRYSEGLGEAIRRLRSGKVSLEGGYDGEFGKVAIFTDAERIELSGGRRPKARLQPLKEGPRKTPRQMAGSLLAFQKEQTRRNSEQKRGVEAPSAGVHLTLDQERAKIHRGTPLLVLAGPGSGKTRLLTERLVWLSRQGMLPEQMAALTFSHRAGEEILSRVKQSGYEGALPFCGTFHSLAWQSIRHNFPDALLLPESHASTLLIQTIEKRHPDWSQSRTRRFASLFNSARERGDVALLPDGQEILLAYTNAKLSLSPHTYDFTDLLEWMKTAPSNGFLPQYEELLVDEIQDVSSLQLAILKALLPSDGNGFFGIGDPDQAIYGFRGSVKHIETELRELWPGLLTNTLSTSFRSSQQILTIAGDAMQSHPASGYLTAARTLTASLRYFEAPTPFAEAKWIANRITELIGATSHTLLDSEVQSKEEGLKGQLAPSDIAILVRLKVQIPTLAKALREQGIPVDVPTEDLFWKEPETEAILKEMELLLLKEKNSPSAGNRLSRLEGQFLATEPGKPEALVSHFLNSGLADIPYFSTRAWKKLCAAYEKSGSWAKLFSDIRWLDETDMLRRKADAVRLLTLHASKGLEFRAVFLPGLEEGILPLIPEMLEGKAESERQTDMEEERRLLYVGLTRASEAIFASRAQVRKIYGREMELRPSPFLRDILGAFQKTRLAKHSRVVLKPQGLV